MSQWTKTPPDEPGWYWAFGGDTLGKAAGLKETPMIIYVGIKGTPAIKWWGPKIPKPEPPIEAFIAPETKYDCEPREGSNIGDPYMLHNRYGPDFEKINQPSDEVICRHCDEAMELLGPEDLPYGLCPARMAEALGLDY